MSTQSKPRRRGEVGAGFAPFSSSSAQDRDEDDWYLKREMSMIQAALEDKGEMRRKDLGRLLGCRYWGPRRFARALKQATREGRIQHTGFGRYGPAGQ